MLYPVTSLTVFTLYMILVWHKGLKSVSASYYELRHKIVFTLVLWGFAIPAMLSGGTVLMFLSGASICFVGVIPDFLGSELEFRTHMAWAVTGITLGMASMGFDFGLWWIPITMSLFIAAMGLLVLIRRKTDDPFTTYFLWIELVALYLINLGLIIK